MWCSSGFHSRTSTIYAVYNDLPNASKLTEPLLFADDTSIFYSHSDPSCLESVLNDELQTIDIWLKCNKLSVNIKKKLVILFSNRGRRSLTATSLSLSETSLLNKPV